MRIISGKLRGRSFDAPTGLVSRPTASRVREAIFNILYTKDKLHNARVLDCFAGSGALSFEAISRGAASASLVESDGAAWHQLGVSSQKMGITEQVSIHRGDFFAIAGKLRGKFDLVFLDPPYRKEYWQEAIELLQEYNMLAEDAVLICELGERQTLPECIGKFCCTDNRRYGNVRIMIYEGRTSEGAPLDLPGEL